MTCCICVNIIHCFILLGVDSSLSWLRVFYISVVNLQIVCHCNVSVFLNHLFSSTVSTSGATYPVLDPGNCFGRGTLDTIPQRQQRCWSGSCNGVPLPSQLGALGSIVSSPSRVRGRAPAINNLYAILCDSRMFHCPLCRAVGLPVSFSWLFITLVKWKSHLEILYRGLNLSRLFCFPKPKLR